MTLDLPKVRAHAAERFPLQPRRVQQWLEELPALDLAETTKRLREALELANRQEVSAKARLESLQLLHRAAQRSLTSLRKQLVARSLPLSVKTQACFRLYQDMTWELQTGYAIVARGSSGRHGWPSRHQALSIHRALALIYDEARMAMALYQPHRPGFWKRAYALYRYGETSSTLDYAPRGGRSSQDLFLHTVLLALSHPYSLRYGELDKFAEFLRQTRPPCRILHNLSSNEAGYASYLDLESDTPPEYAPVERIQFTPDIRTVHLTPLIEHLSQVAENSSPGLRTAITDRAAIPNALSRKLIHNLSSVPARRFSRIPRQDHVDVVCGLSAIHAALMHARRTKTSRATGTEPTTDSAFDTGGYAVQDTAGDDRWQLWEVVNLGPGGYQLHWPHLRPCGAQVGELLAVRVVEAGQTRVYAAAVRWMQARADGYLDIGVQLVAPKVVPIHLQPEDQYLVDNLSAEPGLWLPAVKALNQPPTLIGAVGRFHPGNHVVALGSRGHYVLELSDRVESTGLFERFGYRVLQRAPQSHPSHT